MPTYELLCRDCGHRFDRFVMRLLRESDKVCPECASTRVETGIGGGFVARNGQWDATCVPKGGFS